MTVPAFGEYAPTAFGEVELVGLPDARGLNGTRGTALKTISDGRTVVKLPDGRELAFKAENLQPVTLGLEKSKSPVDVAAARVVPPAFGEYAPSLFREVELVGLPESRGLNGTRGTAVKTISDGRTVVKLPDGRELAFHAANLRSLASCPQDREAAPPTAAAPSITPPSFGEYAPPAFGNVVLKGLPESRGLNGLHGIALKTISDGRTVVKLPDGRELAFKAENLNPLPKTLDSHAACELDLHLFQSDEAKRFIRIHAAAARFHKMWISQGERSARQMLNGARSGESSHLHSLGVVSEEEAALLSRRVDADLRLLALDDIDRQELAA
eukprot:TRINITY_DN67817_c0_g1_i1.p1 TRINITY_DN67817_c0_g1~~TRINITY_DN67817_c0_g1_i1.p1  ORF type:complete len:340 (+),score=51.40 TRINITY_DN67817_c0_g1_i1:42-1022(+)